MVLLNCVLQRIFSWLFCGYLMLFFCGSAMADAPQGATAQRILDVQRTLNRVPGMSAAVWRDGKVIWRGESGFRDLSKELVVNAQTRFRLASVSKVFAATAAAKLAEQGRLDVDAPISDYLAWINPAWAHITSRQLAAHTSGIPHYQAVDALRGGHRFLSAKEAIDTFQSRELLFASGNQYGYSSYGYTLLTGVIEAVSKQDYLDYVQKEIVTDLTIQADMAEKYDGNMSQAYEFSGGQLRIAPAHDYSYSWGGAGMTANATDLVRFGGRMLDGKVVSKQSLAWLQQVTKLNNGSPVADRDFRLGFGWRIGEDEHGQPLMHHAGVTGGARSVIILFPKERMAISLLSNANWTSAIEQTALSLAEVFRSHQQSKVRSPCPINLHRYQGQFGDAEIQGTISFQLHEGRCEAEMQVENALGKWISGAAKRELVSLQLIAYEDQSFARAAMVTPIGSFYLKQAILNTSSLELSAQLNASRRVQMRLLE